MNNTKIPRVYFDSNVYIDIFEGRRPALKEYLINQAEKKQTIFPFSAALVLEITDYPKTDRCNERLDFLSVISNDVYYVHSVWDHEFRPESPHTTYDTNRSACPRLNLAKLFSRLLPNLAAKYTRSKLGLGPNVLNNMTPTEAISAIDAALLAAAERSNTEYRSLSVQIEKSREFAIETHGNQWKSMSTTPEHMLYNQELEQAFILLDFYGYWSDSKRVYAKGSRYADTEHLSAARQCHYLITRDKGMRKRAKAVYELAKLNTEVMSTEAYEAQVLK